MTVTLTCRWRVRRRRRRRRSRRRVAWRSYQYQIKATGVNDLSVIGIYKKFEEDYPKAYDKVTAPSRRSLRCG